MGIIESKQLYNNFVRRVLEAISKDDFEFIEESIDHYPEVMSKVANLLNLLTKAFTFGSVKAFRVLVSELDFSDKTSQLSEIETLIKQRLRSISEADEQKVCDELDMVVEFSNAELEHDLYEIAHESIDFTMHILFFRAYLRANEMEPYKYLKLAKTAKEKLMCMELIST
jgi:hypothetical protein